jgi:hypothetical protein
MAAAITLGWSIASLGLLHAVRRSRLHDAVGTCDRFVSALVTLQSMAAAITLGWSTASLGLLHAVRRSRLHDAVGTCDRFVSALVTLRSSDSASRFFHWACCMQLRVPRMREAQFHPHGPWHVQRPRWPGGGSYISCSCCNFLKLAI